LAATHALKVWRWGAIASLVASGLLTAALPGWAQTQCRQALALGLDVSGSVDALEYGLQLRGLANALRHAEVRAALLRHPGAPVEIAVYEWSAPEYQRLLLPWTAITDDPTLERVARRLETTERRSAPPVTGLGQAMLFGQALLDQRADCWKRTLDISGDGRSNAGPEPRAVKPTLSNMTLNGLAIGADSPRAGHIRQLEIAELSAYFRAEVIFGPDAFVETALGFEDYEEAMVRKLRKELEGLVVSGLRSGRGDQ
jgi:hypothetical protein